MNIPTIVFLILIGIAIGYAIHTLHKSGCNSCTGCRDAHQCPYCSEKQKLEKQI